MWKTCLAVAAAIAAGGGLVLADQVRERDVKLGSETIRVKVRMFWIRHGQSCANVMDQCKVKAGQVDEYLPKVEKALKKYGGEFKSSPLTGVLMEPDGKEPDCMVELVSSKLKAGERSDNGAIIRVHDLVKDPPLTICAHHQSAQAGRSFLAWLRDSGVQVDFLGSSFLMRAFETASAMFLDQDDDFRNAVLKENVKVTPLPYLTERAPQDYTSVQRDNEPRRIEDQIQILKAAALEHDTKFKADKVNDHYAKSWPSLQHFEKFKAFLAAHIVPSLSKVRRDLHWASAPEDVLREALETQLEPVMDPNKHGEKVRVSWLGGSYQTGDGFTKAEYQNIEAPEVTIAFVGHNQMMLEYCLGGDMSKKPNNNAVLEKLFVLEATPGVQAQDIQYASLVMREQSELCSKVMDAPAGSASLASLVYEDVANCQDPYDVSEWIGLQKPEGLQTASSGDNHAHAPSQHTKCMKLADSGVSSYPISPGF